MNFEDLTPEQREKANSCKTPEDIMAFAKELGYELSEDELAALSGGNGDLEACVFVCPELGNLCSQKYW